MDKNRFAMTPPMGWNSYDYYDTTVNEEQVKANADYMAASFEAVRLGVHRCGHPVVCLWGGKHAR